MSHDGTTTFYKYITPNDTGSNGSHQSGFYVGKNAWGFLFDIEGVKGSNVDRFVRISWHGYGETNSRFIYYGKGTRNEYRITQFQKGFPYLDEEYDGSLLVMRKLSEDYFEAQVIKDDADIERWFLEHNVSPATSNQVISETRGDSAHELTKAFQNVLASLTLEYPTTMEMAMYARNIHLQLYPDVRVQIINDPDRILASWLELEYSLFRFIESDRLQQIISAPLGTVERLLEVAQTVLQRRKSRAGKSLEKHLSSMFTFHSLRFAEQVVTELNHKPDFLFPDLDTYRSASRNDERLIVLAAKTTCKDRWRQILNEADKVDTMHLFTLQQGISGAQLDEMIANRVQLVVPSMNLSSFPAEKRKSIMTLKGFIDGVKSKQASI